MSFLPEMQHNNHAAVLNNNSFRGKCVHIIENNDFHFIQRRSPVPHHTGTHLVSHHTGTVPVPHHTGLLLVSNSRTIVHLASYSSQQSIAL